MALQNRNVVNPVPNSQQLSHQLHNFLSIDDEMLALVQRYRTVLLDAITDYPDVGHETLLKFAPTAEALALCQQEGEDPQTIATQQAAYLQALLDADDITAPLLTHAGGQYYNEHLNPLWILGSYYQYIDQLTALVTHSPDIADARTVLRCPPRSVNWCSATWG